uniref:Bacteriocin-protection protein n=1 Tax=Thermosporothrix sp. COM3 TaxID=2490863 RepID=A0A455SHF6_9CHLR|nr:hypothetical protein KTC_26680 [Thermosporothrix sp. COM3]
MSSRTDSPDKTLSYPIITCETQHDWKMWLEKHHHAVKGVWLKLAKKSTGIPSVTREEALDEALCYGWIDGQAKPYDACYWLQKFTPRTRRSTWSKRNRDKVEALQAAGRMQPEGIRQVELAKADGRWQAAYDRPSEATVPEDFQRELDKNPQALDFFSTLNSRNRYAILFRIQTAKKAETRAARIRTYVDMLARNEKLYP